MKSLTFLVCILVCSLVQAQSQCPNGVCPVPQRVQYIAPMVPQQIIPQQVAPLQLQGFTYQARRVGLFGWRLEWIPVPVYQRQQIQPQQQQQQPQQQPQQQQLQQSGPTMRPISCPSGTRSYYSTRGQVLR